MVGLLAKLFGCGKKHRQILQEVEQIETRRRSDDIRIKKLEIATLNGDEEWLTFLNVAKKDPSCALRVIEECQTNAKTR